MASRPDFRGAAAVLEGIARKHAPQDSGRYAGSLRGRATRDGVVVESPERYAQYVNQGGPTEGDLKALDAAVMAALDQAEQ